TGYALMPAAIGEILVGLIYLILLPWFNPEIQNFQETFSAVNYIRNSFFGMTGLIIRLIEILACGVYLIIMVKYANEFNWFEAIITTSIPILLFFFLVLSYYFL
ncbi:MAG: hypothetical protein U9O98_11525, partial [Asgard group archaeon]|nr:hypothetical protein [Asgard group archaeon]